MTKCNRCRTRYKKTLNECPTCAELSDEEVEKLLQTKDDDNESMGKTMLYLLVIVTVVFVLALIFV